MDVTAVRNEESGHIELGVQEGDHFVAFTTMPTTQFDATIANLSSAADADAEQSS